MFLKTFRGVDEVLQNKKKNRQNGEVFEKNEFQNPRGPWTFFSINQFDTPNLAENILKKVVRLRFVIKFY